MTTTVAIKINGITVQADAGINVVAALALHGKLPWRRSISGDWRAPLCGMGQCFECRVRIDGVMQRACQLLVADGMEIDSDV